MKALFSRRTAALVLLTIASFSLPVHAPGQPAISAAHAAANLFGHNLIVNGDAEAGPGAMDDSTFISPPGWRTPGLPRTKGLTVASYTGSSLDLSLTTPGPRNRGKNYFYGGPSGSKDTSTEQRISLAGAASAIDAGTVTFTLSGWLGGLSSQRDNALLRAVFLNSAGMKVGDAVLGPVTPSMRKQETGLFLQQVTKQLPTGTRTVVVDLLMKWYDGSDNDGMADNLSLVLKAPAA